MSIQEGPFFLPPQENGHPGMVGRRASRKCGCQVLVGVRIDNHEAATFASACCTAHVALMERFNLALGDSLVNPTDQPLDQVVDEILNNLDEEAP